MSTATSKSQNPQINETRKFLLFVDTNVIKTSDDDIELLPSSFNEQWSNLSKNGDIDLIIPEVVFQELAYQKFKFYYTSYTNAKGKIEKIQKTIDLKNKFKATKDYFKNEVLRILNLKIEQTSHCHLAKVPYEQINSDKLRNIVTSAIWRLPPYKEDKEGSGFRDAIILETIHHYHHNLLHCDISFITKDQRLSEAAEKKFKGFHNFAIFSDLTEFENFVIAARSKYDTTFLHKIISKAGKAFFNLNTQKGVFFKLKLDQKLIAEYKLEVGKLAIDHKNKKTGLGFFGALGGYTAYECTNNPVFFTGKTSLLSIVGLEENKFHWSSTLFVVTKYKEASRASTLLTEVDKNEYEKIFDRVLVLQVEWESVVSKRNLFTNVKIIDIKLKEEFYDSDDDNIKKVI